MSVNADYLPLSGKPFTISMGLRSLDLANWLEFDANYDAELDLKRVLYRTHPYQVFASMPEGLTGSWETLDLISEFLKTQPATFYESGFSHSDFAESNEGLSLRTKLETPSGSRLDHPLVSASLLVQEDLCVMSRLNGEWVLTAASVCFPSRWDLTEKIGKSLQEIHNPVPHYKERIGTATDTMFDKFDASRPVWRLNWTILDNPELFQPSSGQPRTNPEMTSSELAGLLQLRVERQTLRVLPESKDVLFTIRTHQDSLANIADKYPQFQENLADTLAAASDQTKAYKGWEPFWEQLLAWTRNAG